ncbi:UNVERIFIED_CONTAM: hypothetical protein FKN15_047521 [Acipenser sinensis]
MPAYPRVLSASEPRCRSASVPSPRCTKASTPLCLDALCVQVLPDISGFMPRCSITLVHRCFGILCAWVLRHPQCLEDSTSRRFNAFEAYKLCGSLPSVPQRPIAPSTSVLRHPLCLEDNMPF